MNLNLMETPLNNLRITPRSNLPKIKDGAYVINYDEYATVGTRLITIYVKTDLATDILLVLVLNISLKRLKSL